MAFYSMKHLKKFVKIIINRQYNDKDLNLRPKRTTALKFEGACICVFWPAFSPFCVFLHFLKDFDWEVQKMLCKRAKGLTDTFFCVGQHLGISLNFSLFSLFFLHFCIKTLQKHGKRRFQPTLGCRITRKLVEIYNMCEREWV